MHRLQGLCVVLFYIEICYRMLNLNNPENICFISGLGATMLSCIARNIKQTSTFTIVGFFKILADTIVCTLLTLGVSLSLHEYYQMSYVYTIAIGTFIGSMGSSYIIEIANQLLRKVLKLDENK